MLDAGQMQSHRNLTLWGDSESGLFLGNIQQTLKHITKLFYLNSALHNKTRSKAREQNYLNPKNLNETKRLLLNSMC